MTVEEPDKSHYQALLSQGLDGEASSDEPDISGYEIERLLGRGGMSKVYLARESALNRMVALKIFNTNAIDAICIERFNQEAQLMAQIQHPHIVSIYGSIASSKDLPCLVLEYVPGGDLRSKLTELGTLPLHEALKITMDVCSGLAAIHDKSIVHRDINPANILLDENGSAKVADLGIALNKQETNESDALTMTGTFVGTMAYLAPEQISGSRNDISPRTDVWAVGVLLFEMLQGAPPQALLVSDLLGEVPASVRPILKKCLRRNPNDRYPDILTLKKDLEKLAKPPHKPTRKQLYLLATAGVLTITGLSVYFYQNYKNPSPHPGSASVPNAQQSAPNPTRQTQPIWMSVLNRFSPPLRPLRGSWHIRRNILQCEPHSRGAVIPLPTAPPGNSYDISLTFARTSGIHSIAVFLPTSIGMINFDLDGWSNHVSGIQNINGMDMRAHGEHFLFTIENHRNYNLLLEVREHSVTAFVDGKKHYQWDLKGRTGTLTQLWKVPIENQLALGAWNSTVEFHHIKIRKYSP